MSPLAAVFAAEAVVTEFHAENSWFPETKEIVWGGMAFLIVAFMLWKFAGPAIKKALGDRTERIQRDLDRAAGARSEAEAQAAAISSGLQNLGQEQARIRSDAQEAAAIMEREGRARIDAEAEEHQAKAETDLEAARRSAGADLQQQVVVLALDATDRIVERSLTPEVHTELVERYIAKVGASS